MTDICTRCNGIVQVIEQSRPDGTAFICVQCGRQTDFMWNEDVEPESEARDG